MRILYVINNINIGGATDALLYIVQNCTTNSRKIICRNNYLQNIEIVEGSGKLIYNTFIAESYDLIHYFKAESSVLFDELCEEMKRKNRILPIITTVCQYPREFKLRLTPNEIQYNQQIVFIDKHAYNCEYNKHIPTERKTMTRYKYKNTIMKRQLKLPLKLFSAGEVHLINVTGRLLTGSMQLIYLIKDFL